MATQFRLVKKSLNNVKSSLQKEIIKNLRDKEIREKLGEIHVESIKDDYRPAAEKTIEWRERYDSLNKTDPSYSRFFVNFAFTGQLLEDLKKNVRLDRQGGLIRFIFGNSKKKHKKYQGKTKKIGSASPMDEIESGLNKLGYNNEIKEDAKKEMTSFIKDFLIKKLRQVFKA